MMGTEVDLTELSKEQLADMLSVLVRDKQVGTQQYKTLHAEIARRELETMWKEPEIGEVPTKSLVDFPELWPIFKNTHEHLDAFNLVEKELQLDGEEYYPIKKALCYYIESLRQNTVSFNVGLMECDNRIHLGFEIPAGRGKGQIKKMVGRFKLSEFQTVCYFPATRINVEQLIGKFVGEGKNQKEVRGYFGYKSIVVDECQDFLSEKERDDANTMLEMRTAMDIWPYNEVHKKLTGVKDLGYSPEIRTIFLMHYGAFGPTFFDRGTFRRMFMFSGGTAPIPFSAGSDALKKTATSAAEFVSYVNSFGGEEKPVFGGDAVDELVSWIDSWNLFVLTHPNQRLRSVGLRSFTSVKQLFGRLCAILAISRHETNVSIDTVRTACFDCVHFLLHTYKIYANEGMVNLSRDVWRTTDQREAMVFEWLWYNHATSEDASKLSIEQVQTMIGETFGLMDRQARGVFGRLVEQGLIAKKKGAHVSKVWLAFTPNIEGGVELPEGSINFMEFLTIQSGKRGKLQAPPPSIYNAQPIPIIIPINIDNKKGGEGSNSATLATLKANTVLETDTCSRNMGVSSPNTISFESSLSGLQSAAQNGSKAHILRVLRNYLLPVGSVRRRRDIVELAQNDGVSYEEAQKCIDYLLQVGDLGMRGEAEVKVVRDWGGGEEEDNGGLDG